MVYNIYGLCRRWRGGGRVTRPLQARFWSLVQIPTAAFPPWPIKRLIFNNSVTNGRIGSPLEVLIVARMRRKPCFLWLLVFVAAVFAGLRASLKKKKKPPRWPQFRENGNNRNLLLKMMGRWFSMTDECAWGWAARSLNDISI
jgi:hypothetical protein